MILDFAGLCRPIVGAVIAGKWKIFDVTPITRGFCDVEEVNNNLQIRVRSTVGEIPPIGLIDIIKMGNLFQNLPAARDERGLRGSKTSLPKLRRNR
jgi:hypothetical protein